MTLIDNEYDMERNELRRSAIGPARGKRQKSKHENKSIDKWTLCKSIRRMSWRVSNRQAFKALEHKRG